MFMLVLNGTEDLAEIGAIATYFLAFAHSARSPDDPRPYLLSVISHADKMEIPRQNRVRRTVKEIQKRFQVHFVVDEEPTVLNCTVRSQDTELLKTRIAATKKKCIQVYIKGSCAVGQQTVGLGASVCSSYEWYPRRHLLME